MLFKTLLTLLTFSGTAPVVPEAEPLEPGTSPVEPAAAPVEPGAVPGKSGTSREARSLGPCHAALLQRLQGPCLALEEKSSWSRRTSEKVLARMLFRCLLWGSLPCANKSLAFIFLRVELSEVR